MSEESIYKLIPAAPPVTVKSAKYQSKYPHDTAPTASTFGASIASQIPVTNVGGEYDAPFTLHPVKKTAANIGFLKTDKPNPKAFTKKHAHEKNLPERMSVE